MIKKEFEGETAAKFFNQKKILALLEEHKEGKVTHSIQIWVVYTFLMWYRAYFINNGDFEKNRGRLCPLRIINKKNRFVFSKETAG